MKEEKDLHNKNCTSLKKESMKTEDGRTSHAHGLAESIL
jgi:hypothetical protein